MNQHGLSASSSRLSDQTLICSGEMITHSREGTAFIRALTCTPSSRHAEISAPAMRHVQRLCLEPDIDSLLKVPATLGPWKMPLDEQAVPGEDATKREMVAWKFHRGVRAMKLN